MQNNKPHSIVPPEIMRAIKTDLDCFLAEGVKLSHQLGVQLLIWLVLGNGIAAKVILDHAFSSEIKFEFPARCAVALFSLGLISAVFMAIVLYFLNSKAVGKAGAMSGRLGSMVQIDFEELESMSIGLQNMWKQIQAASLILASLSGVFFLSGTSVVLFFF